MPVHDPPDEFHHAGSFVRQVHTDWARSAEVARVTHCPNSTKQGDFRHMFAEVIVKLWGKINARGERQKQCIKEEVLELLLTTRSHCTSLAEFHLVWSLYFQHLQDMEEGEVVKYLKTIYFFRLSTDEAAKQYGLTNPVLAEDGILCAAWWIAYCRQQPGSGSGTQSLEAKHIHGFRASLVDDEGHPLHRLAPCKFFPHDGRCAKIARSSSG